MNNVFPAAQEVGKQSKTVTKTVTKGKLDMPMHSTKCSLFSRSLSLFTMSASATAIAEPDLALQQAMSKRFHPRGTGSASYIDRTASVRTGMSEWEIFVGEQFCPVPGGGRGVRMLVVNVVEVFEGYRHCGVFKQGMRLLMGQMAIDARTPVLEFRAVRNTRLYLWALRQPHVYVSPYNPESIFLLLGSDWVKDAVPVELYHQAAALRALAQQEPAVSQNMAHTFITNELFEAEMTRRRSSLTEVPLEYEGEEEDDRDTLLVKKAERIEQHTTFLNGSLLHDACKPWIEAWCARQISIAQDAPSAAAPK
jgi:hypothetical protein